MGSYAAQGARGAHKLIKTTLKTINLRCMKRVTVSMDPTSDNISSARNVLFHLSTPVMRSTNRACGIKFDVKTDKSLPQIEILFTDNKKVTIMTANLHTLDLLDQISKLVQSKSTNIKNQR